MFPEPTLSSADVVQRILDVFVMKRFPRVVLEGSVLYLSRKLYHLASVTICLVDLQELEFLPDKIEIRVPTVPQKIAHLLLVRAVELASAHSKCAPHYFLSEHLTRFCLAAASYSEK